MGGAEIFCEHIAPDLVAWTGPDEVAAIKMEFDFTLWQEDADPQKWDPRNKETADHSLPYIVSRMIIDKEIYLDSFTKEKYMDPAVRELMNKVTIHPHNDPAFGNGTRITVRKKSGEERVFTGKPATPMSHDELVAKYNRICDLKQISKDQADRAREQWMNLKDCKDIADAMQSDREIRPADAFIGQDTRPEFLRVRAPGATRSHELAFGRPSGTVARRCIPSEPVRATCAEFSGFSDCVL